MESNELRKLFFVFFFVVFVIFDVDFFIFRFGKLTILESGRANFGVFDEFVNNARIDFDEEVTNVDVVQAELAIQICQIRAVKTKIHKPIKTFALSFDRIGKAAFFPLTADKDLSSGVRDEFVDLSGHTFRITSITPGIQNEHSFVNVKCQGFTPKMKKTNY